MSWLLEVVKSDPFLNGFWIFVGIVAGAAIQHLLARLTAIRQTKTAVKMLQTEVAYNLDEVDRFKFHVARLKERIAAGQMSDDDMFFPMHRFDYSVVSPLMNSGYFHVLLGAERMKKYLEFNHFFRVENGEFLTASLQENHETGESLDFLDWVLKRSEELSSDIRTLQASKLNYSGTKLVQKK